MSQIKLYFENGLGTLKYISLYNNIYINNDYNILIEWLSTLKVMLKCVVHLNLYKNGDLTIFIPI